MDGQAAAWRRDEVVTPLLAGFALAATAFAATGVRVAIPLAALLLAGLVAVHRPFIAWDRVLVALVLVILFIPIRRYRFPGELPFQVEPYRVIVALILGAWVASLLADPRVRLRRSRLDGPLTLVVVATLASIAANPARAEQYEPTVLKAVTFLLSFFIVFYLVVSVLRTQVGIDRVARTLVGGGAALGLLAVVEARTGFSPFTRLDSLLPFLIPDPVFAEGLVRSGAVRAFGPAEHPIALGAAFVILIPIAIYVVRTAGPRWWLALGALTLGLFATSSRTGIVMLVAVGAVFLALRPKETRRLWPLLVPVVVVTHFAVPGTLGSLKSAFFPEGGLVEEQRSAAFGCDSSGRIADIAPTLGEVAKKPFFGYGYGTRISTGPDSNACVLDDQWLGTLVDVGIFGFAAWLWLFLAVLRRLGGAAKGDDTPRGWLLVGVAASVTAYAIGMATFDAFSFIQVTFLLFIVLGLGAAAAASSAQEWAPAPSAVRRSGAGVLITQSARVEAR